MVGLDRFLTQLAFTDLDDFFTSLEAWLTTDPGLVDALQTLQQPPTSGVETPAPAAVEQTMSKQSARFSSKLLARFVTWAMNVGRVQLLRNEFRLELNQMCRVSSQQLEASLQTLNGAVMLELSAHQKSVAGSETKISESDGIPDTQMLCELSEYLLYAGLHNPMHKVYVLVARKTARLCAAFLFVMVTRTLERVSAPTSGGHQELDDAPFVVGVATLLRQMHADVSAAFVQLMCQFIVVHMRLSIR